MKTTNNLTEIIRSIVSIGLMLLMFMCMYLFISNQLELDSQKIFIILTMCLSFGLFSLIIKSNK